ncbi:MAG: DUF4783 domain-containing protein [Saprospiraceae bacterium]|nr:DUF4783 domain-containing protein [Lewinella sp.]
MKSLKAIFAISLIFISLILITVIATIRAEVIEEDTVQTGEGVIKALQTGVANKVSAYFASNINFFIPDNPIYSDSTDAAQSLATLFRMHPVQDFEQESLLPGNAANISYLKGTLHTQNQDFALYATIYNGKVEQFDLNALKNRPD